MMTLLEGRRPPLPTFLVCALALSIAACDAPPVTTPPATPQTPIRRAEILPASSPLARTFEIDLFEPGGVQVEYWTEGGERLRRTVAEPRDLHHVPLTRLRAGATYHVELRVLNDDFGPATGSFETEPLPEDLALLDFTTTGEGTHPLTAVELVRGGGGFEGVVIVDRDGEVVWYFRAASTTGFVRRSNGNFVLLSWIRGLVELSPDGEVVHELAQEPPEGRWLHHDVITTPANTVLFLANETRDVDGQDIAGEAIWEWVPETGETTKHWSAFDHFVPADNWGAASIPSDWLHANSIALGPRGNILVSVRFLDQVFSISPDYQDIEWRLGGINADVPTEEGARFVGQHTASELAPVDGERHVLLFDNGSHARGYSRALELAFDPQAGTARKVWEFRPTPDNFAFITSLARRLENGNTFVAFGPAPGVIGSRGPVEAYEATDDGSVLWHLEVDPTGVLEAGTDPDMDGAPPLFVMYRASPLATIGGEVTVP